MISNTATDDQTCSLTQRSLGDLGIDESQLAGYSAYLKSLAASVCYNLNLQHDWSNLAVHLTSPKNDTCLPRPLLSGLPPKRIYVHPDEQAEILKAEHAQGRKIAQSTEHEWVFPTHINETITIKDLAYVFDAITVTPMEKLGSTPKLGPMTPTVGAQWRGQRRQKRLLLATIHPDSTVVYYIIHDGIVKPRQN